ncbi:hypothetical protein ILUMI_07912 [Ignelater luminosus]|uniref:Uncharacterized protein n=1 Tax=Ignelater luminosus TaxID=2038154 RepID=A0A8K0D6L9_IGNLU|nr:hypothetical protein ILUMI_07912 [Ignelater luminosus]
MFWKKELMEKAIRKKNYWKKPLEKMDWKDYRSYSTIRPYQTYPVTYYHQRLLQAPPSQSQTYVTANNGEQQQPSVPVQVPAIPIQVPLQAQLSPMSNIHNVELVPCLCPISSNMDNERPQESSVYDNLHYRKEEDVALISLNTTGLLENKPNIPQVLHFLYPRYNFQQPQHKLIRKAPKPVRNKQIIRPRRPWAVGNRWRLASPGKPVQDYPLREPSPGATGGSPPPSPLYNIYRDNRIPVNDNFLHHQESQIKFPENNLNDRAKTIEGGRYSDPDYYRYGIYDQNHFNTPTEGYNRTSETDTSVKYYYHSTFSMSPEKVVTVTPTTSWVPIPQISKINKRTINENKSKNSSSKINFKSGGFKSFNAKNCTTRFYNNRIETFPCPEQPVLASNSSDAQFYIEEISVKPQEEVKGKKKGRSSDQGDISSNDIVTAKYPEDDFGEIYISAKRSDSVRAGRSEMGLSAVVSGSLLVHEN